MNKSLISFVLKEFKHIIRDKRTMLILLVMPVVLIFLLGFALSTDIKNMDVAYMSTSDSDLVQKIIAGIDASPYFTVVERASDETEISEMFKSGKADAAIRFDDNRGLQIIIDATNPNVGASEAMYLSSIINDQMKGKTAVSAEVKMPVVKMLYNPRMQSSFNFIPGILGLILILICAMMTSASIVREKETGTMEVLLTSPVKPFYIILAKMVPYFVLSCINIAMILLLARFVLGVPLTGSLSLILLLCVVYTVMSLAIGLLVSTITSSQAAALIVSAIVLMVPVMMLSGMMFPIESMPAFFRVFSYIVPARWFIDAMRKLMIEGLDFRYVASDLAVLAGMTLVFMAVAVRKFNSRLE